MDSSDTQKPFPLLKLPPEIRDHIWRHVVVKNENVLIRKHVRGVSLRNPCFPITKPEDHTDWRWRSSWLAVAFTCRQMYLEVTPIYYSANVFCPYGVWAVGDYRKFVNFTASIGPDNASIISGLSLFEFSVPVEEYMSRLPGLKRLYSMNHAEEGWEKRLTALARKHVSLAVVHDGEVWGLDEWILYPGEE